MEYDTFIKLFGPTAVPVVTAAIAYLKDRAERKRLAEIIKREAARISFWRAYYEACILVESEQSREITGQDVLTQLAAAAETVREAQIRESAQDTHLKLPVGFFRRAFLAYKPPQPWVWVLRLFYYYYLGYSLLATVILPLRWINLGSVSVPNLLIYVGVVIAVGILRVIVRYTEDAVIRYESKKKTK